MLRIFIASLALLFFTAVTARAQTDPFAAAKQSIEQGDLDRAEAQVRDAMRLDTNSQEGRFLLGQIAGRRGDWSDAIGYYQSILNENPNLTRVRLELARAELNNNEDTQARIEFQRVLQTPQLPQLVVTNVQAFLKAIREKKYYYLNVGVFGVYDTNTNAATNNQQIVLFGLPFSLSSQAVQTPSFGVTVTGNGEYWWPFGSTWRLRAGGAFYRNDYQGGQFDDMAIRGYVGPQVYLPDHWDASLLGVYGYRWFGNANYSEAAGTRLEVGKLIGQKLRVENDLEFDRMGYPVNSILDGYTISDQIGATYLFSSSSFVRPFIGFGYEHTMEPNFTDVNYTLGAVLHYRFDSGIIIEANPQYYYAKYQGRDPLFGSFRQDHLWAARLSVADDQLNFFGLVPTLNYAYTRDVSNVLIYAYSRHQVQIGFTRQF